MLETKVIAGFFTGGALAVRGGWAAARNSAIGCGVLLAVIEGVGIGLNRMMAGNNRPQNPPVGPVSILVLGAQLIRLRSCSYHPKPQQWGHFLLRPTADSALRSIP